MATTQNPPNVSGLDAPYGAAQFMALEAWAYEHGLRYATDAADRDARFSDAPIGALVSSGPTGELWQKKTTGAVWTTLYSDTGIVTAGFTAGPDWALVDSDPVEASQVGQLVTVQGSVQWNGADLVGGTGGTLGDKTMLTIPPRFAPRKQAPGVLMAFFWSGTIVLATGGTMVLTCMHGTGATVRSGDVCRFALSYRAAF